MPILHHFELKKIFILLGLLSLIFLIAITPMYIKNYRELKNYYANLPTETTHEQFVKIEFTKNNNKIEVKHVTSFTSDLIARAQKPENGFTIIVEENGKNVFESYINRESQTPLAIVPYKANATLVIKNLNTSAEIARYSFAELVKNAQIESAPQRTTIKRNIARDAIYLTWLQVKSKFKNPISSNKGTEKQPEANTNTTSNLPTDPSIRAIAQIAPFTNDFMAVFYYPKVQSFTVIIIKEPFTEGKNQAIAWFKDHQVKNLCDLKLEFRSADKQKTLTTAERNTPNCPQSY